MKNFALVVLVCLMVNALFWTTSKAIHIQVLKRLKMYQMSQKNLLPLSTKTGLKLSANTNPQKRRVDGLSYLPQVH